MERCGTSAATRISRYGERTVLRDFPHVASSIEDETGDAQLGNAIAIAFHTIGRGNLYSATSGRSERTLHGALEVAALTVAAGYPVLDGRYYLESPFSEGNGWGNGWRPQAWSSRAAD